MSEWVKAVEQLSTIVYAGLMSNWTYLTRTISSIGTLFSSLEEVNFSLPLQVGMPSMMSLRSSLHCQYDWAALESPIHQPIQQQTTMDLRSHSLLSSWNNPTSILTTQRLNNSNSNKYQQRLRNTINHK